MHSSNIGLLVTKILTKTKKYINKYYNKSKYVVSFIKNGIINLHYWCIDNRVYVRTGYELGNIVLNGFFIWIMLFPIVSYNPIWFIPSYGVIPWMIVSFIKEIKQ